MSTKEFFASSALNFQFSAAGRGKVFTRGSEQFAGSHIWGGPPRFDGKRERQSCLTRDTHFTADQHSYFGAKARQRLRRQAGLGMHGTISVTASS